MEEAFAGLDVYKEFAGEKDALLDESDDESTQKGPSAANLAGWGSWTGEGVVQTKRQLAKERRAKQKKEAAKKARNAARKDASLKNVIINERITKKFKKYQVQKLPFEFSDTRHFDRTLAQPLGPEWNTSSSFGRMNKAAVLVRPGLMISPLSEPLAKKPAKPTKGAPAPKRA